MILQLNPQIPVYTPRGEAVAIGWIDYSEDHDLFWVCALNESRQVWIVNNKDVRIAENPTMDREFKSPDELFREGPAPIRWERG